MTAARKRTGNPAKKATSVRAWKQAAKNEPIELPSGNYMTIRKVGLNALIQAGMLPNSLLGIAQKAVAKGKAQEPSQEDLVNIVDNPEKVSEIMGFFDKLVCFVAQEPEVHPVPKQGVERDDETLYVDEVDEEDKMFIFQVVTGGTTDVEQFRRELGATLGTLRGSEDVELPAE